MYDALVSSIPPTSASALLKQFAGVDLPPGCPDLDFPSLNLQGQPKLGPFQLRGESKPSPTGARASIFIERKAMDAPTATPSLKLELHLPAQPELADGLGLGPVELHYKLDSARAWSATGTLLAQIFGHSISLHASLSGLENNSEGLHFIFEEQSPKPLLDLGEFGSFRLMRLELQKKAGQEAFEVRGRGRLELQGLFFLKAGQLLLEGELQAVSGGEAGGNYLRLDFLESKLSFEAVGGISFILSPRHLYFPAEQSGPFDLEMTAGLILLGLPPWVQPAFSSEVLAEISVGSRGLQLRVASWLGPLSLQLPNIESLAGGEPIELGCLLFSAERLSLKLGRELSLSVELGLGLPQAFNRLASIPLFETIGPDEQIPKLKLALTLRGGEVEVRLLQSPLQLLNLKPRAGGVLEAELNLGSYGSLFFTMPVLRLDLAQGRLIAEGVFRYRDLRIPLAPLLSLLQAGNMDALANRLPESLLLQALSFDGAMSLLIKLLDDLLGKGILSEPVREALEALSKQSDRLPEHLRSTFFNIVPPQELGFRLALHADFSVHLCAFVPPELKAPLRFVVPMLGPRGPELLGISLHSLAIGEFLGGQVCSLEIDAEVERFELLSIALAASLSGSGHFPTPGVLEQRILCRELFALMLFGAGAPLVIPLFFKELGLVYTGLDGLEADIRLRLPAPKLGFSAIAGALQSMSGLRAFLSNPEASKKSLIQSPAELRPILSLGPCYIRFPPYLGGETLGFKDMKLLGEAPELVPKVLETLQTLDFDELLGAISTVDELNSRPIELSFGPTYRKAIQLWSTLVEPAARVASGPGLEGEPSGNAAKKDALSWRIGAIRGRIAQGISALRGGGDTIRVQAKVLEISARHLRLSVLLDEPGGGPPREIPLELRWNHWIEGLALLGGKLSGGEE